VRYDNHLPPQGLYLARKAKPCEASHLLQEWHSTQHQYRSCVHLLRGLRYGRGSKVERAMD